MAFFSKAIHISVDLALLAGFLAGIKKNTGIEPNVKLLNQPELEKYAYKYLELGDYLYNQSAEFMSSSYFFRRK
ncbi:hypothetical protein HPODL_05161 [Ogataea parapolymorpha DL-1]|uniref:DUF1748-domain-containing protein n=1 Tax=Ogataea parapolymorpha (strain ATCC 26012 / BCRC 20466 / JCM 22074 / NRRL Y-7560 / DL-1) TaxID=871575 RepID=W1QGH4_OGAPD|nr:hypothetical protein HPODL_05161 [Ogataea parapolymorpha DL-1]ESX01177.1 hypothetical protein HPODL_05161 [Ogataea parapolymorpha DL-1]